MMTISLNSQCDYYYENKISCHIFHLNWLHLIMFVNSHTVQIQLPASLAIFFLNVNMALKLEIFWVIIGIAHSGLVVGRLYE